MTMMSGSCVNKGCKPDHRIGAVTLEIVYLESSQNRVCVLYLFGDEVDLTYTNPWTAS